MILVTGGAGFIGSHLVEALLRQGHEVRVLDNLSTGKKENLEEATGYAVPNAGGHESTSHLLPLGDRAEFLLGDVSDLETCRRACRGVTYIFHQAAIGSVQRSIAYPVSTHQVNATGTLNILQAAKEMQVKRVVYASSSSVYGNIASNPEESIPSCKISRGKRSAPRYENPRSGEVEHSLAAIDLARAHLEYEIKVGLPEGLLTT